MAEMGLKSMELFHVQSTMTELTIIQLSSAFKSGPSQDHLERWHTDRSFCGSSPPAVPARPSATATLAQHF